MNRTPRKSSPAMSKETDTRRSVTWHQRGADSLSRAERDVLSTFRRFLMTPHQMLCFYGPSLEQNQAALKSLTEMEMLVKESFKGAYSLTESGYAAMRICDGVASK
jgi:hypothetical protein